MRSSKLFAKESTASPKSTLLDGFIDVDTLGGEGREEEEREAVSEGGSAPSFGYGAGTGVGGWVGVGGMPSVSLIMLLTNPPKCPKEVVALRVATAQM